MSKNYLERLKDPRWQKKRLEVFEHAGWKCQHCGDDQTTLVVHHINYKKGHEPWEYGKNELLCLCENCHKKRHTLLKEIEILLGDAHFETIEFISGLLKFLEFPGKKVKECSKMEALAISIFIEGYYAENPFSYLTSDKESFSIEEVLEKLYRGGDTMADIYLRTILNK